MWGSDVYTDDSDPLAAAIHNGWIRGQWGDEVDTSALDLGSDDTPVSRSKGGKSTSDASTTLSSRPSSPMVPPPQKDLHITLLILPALQRYTSHVSHGLKSRAWESKHDGLSFKIERITWVDEGAGKGEERSGEARRKRLKVLIGLRDIARGRPVRLNLVARDLGGMQPAAVAA